METERAAAEMQQAHEMAEVNFRTAEREASRSRKASDFGAYSRSQLERAEDELEKAGFALRHAARNLAAQPAQQRLEVQSLEANVRRQQVLVDDLARQVEALQVRSPVAGQVGQLQVADRATVATAAAA